MTGRTRRRSRPRRVPATSLALLAFPALLAGPALLALLALPVSAGAQSAPDPAGAREAGAGDAEADGTGVVGAQGLCFRAAPIRECRSFLVGEVALGRRLFGTDAPEGRSHDQMMNWRVVFEVGAMRNRDERSALGASGVLRLGDEVLVWGARGRYRRWLENGDAVELSAAALVASASERPPEAGPLLAAYDGIGVEVGASWSPVGWLAVGAEVVSMPFAGGGRDLSLQPSLRVTGPAGLIGGLLFGAVAATDPSMGW